MPNLKSLLPFTHAFHIFVTELDLSSLAVGLQEFIFNQSQSRSCIIVSMVKRDPESHLQALKLVQEEDRHLEGY